MHSTSETVEAYLRSLPTDRREAISRLRQLILKNLPKGYEEGMQYGMISYHVPLQTYPTTYNGEPLSYIALASQKNYMSLYLMAIYGGNENEFRTAYQQSGKKLNMGKSCIRFKQYEDLPEPLLAKTIASYTPKQFIELYELTRG